MASKTPYEIRLELLQMAHTYLSAQQATAVKFAHDAFTAAIQANQATIEQWKEYQPTPYTIDEIMAKATELAGFVNNKN